MSSMLAIRMPSSMTDGFTYGWPCFMSFDGIDLTVRPNGHILPERVETDLPKAIEDMRKVDLTPSG